MRVYLRDPAHFFRWLEANGFSYAVLRGYRNMGECPARGGKEDMDVLLEDRAAEAVSRSFRGVPKRLGIKCDLYSVTAGHGADFVGGPYFPAALAGLILQRRVRWRDAFYVPCDHDLYVSLLYHLAYQKAEACRADATDPLAFRAYKRYGFVKELAQRLGRPYDLSLFDMHRLLAEEGFSIDPDTAVRYLQNQFKHLFKSRFFALLLAARQPGELNLFVLRAKAVRRGFRAATGRPSPAANAAPRFSGAELPPYASRLCAAVKSGETPQVMGHGVLLSLRRGLAYLPAHSSRDG